MIKTWINRSRHAVVTAVSCVVLTTMTTGVMAQDKAPAVLSLLPANSEMAIIIPGLTRLNQKLATLNTAMGMSVPWMADTLGEAKRAAGMVKGINDEGSMAIILNGIIEAADADAEVPPFLVLMPVSNYTEFLSNFNTLPASDGLTTADLPQSGDRVFVRQIEGYALMGADRALVKAYAPGNAGPAMASKAGKLAGQYLASGDIVFIADMGVFGPKLTPKIDAGVREGLAEIQADPLSSQGSPADVSTMLNLYGNAAKSLVNSTNMVVISLDINELGVGMTYATQFKDGSEISKLIKTNNAPAAKLLESVSGKPYSLALSQSFGSIDLSKIITDISQAFATRNPELSRFIALTIPLIEQTSGMATVYQSRTGNPIEGMFNTVSIISTKDSAAYVQTFRAYLTQMSRTSLPVPLPPDEQGMRRGPAVINFFTQFNANTTTINGVAVDQYEMRYDIPPDLMAQGGGQLMFASMTAQRGYVAQVDNKVIITGNTDLEVITEAIRVAKEGNGLSANQGINQVREQLSPAPAFEAYVSFSSLGRTLVNLVGMMGQPLDLKVPDNLPPVGYSVSLTENGMASRTFIPMPVIKFTKEASVTLTPIFMGMTQMQQQGSGQNATPQQRQEDSPEDYEQYYQEEQGGRRPPPRR